MKSFKTGATYKLRKKYINDLQQAVAYDLGRVAINNYNNFTFTANSVDCGVALLMNGATVAYASERHMFKRIDNKWETTMKEKKPFKVGATYKLKKKYVDDFHQTSEIIEKYGDGVFEFTVVELDGDGDAFDRNEILMAYNGSERHMFKRVDNK